MIARVLIAILRPFIYVLFPYRVEGAEKFTDAPDARLILCANHVSNWDPILLLIGQSRFIHFMAKAELFRFKPLGWLLLHVAHAFPVERGKGDTRALDTAREVVESGNVLGIFPEGTRSRTGKLMRFRSGAALIAAHTGATVIPCGIDRAARLFRRVTIRFGDPISPEELHLTGEHPDIRYAARLIRSRVKELSGQEDAQ